MAATNVVLANSALTLIGSGRRITSLSDPSKEARTLNDNFDLCRKAVLRDHPWNFAVKRAKLETPDATAPVFEYANRFALPADFIRVHTVLDEGGVRLVEEDYRIEEAFFATDFGKIYLKYVFNITDPTKFDPIFDEALAAALALKCCYSITGSDSRDQALRDTYDKVMKKAKFVDGVEEPSEKLDADEWVRARMGNSGFVRDPQT